MTTYEEHLAENVTRARAALERSQDRLAVAEADLGPAEAEHLAAGDGFVGHALLELRHAVEVAARSVARAETALADAQGRIAQPTLPGLE